MQGRPRALHPTALARRRARQFVQKAAVAEDRRGRRHPLIARMDPPPREAVAVETNSHVEEDVAVEAQRERQVDDGALETAEAEERGGGRGVETLEGGWD